MAVAASLIGSAKCFRKLQYMFAGAGKNSSCAFGAVTSWRRQCSSHSEQVSNESHMFDSMDNPYKEPPKRCVLCHVHVDYKNVQLLSQFISPYTGRILGKHITGLCPKKQKEISRAIKRAHHLGFMSVTYKDPTFRSDPKICNVRYPD